MDHLKFRIKRKLRELSEELAQEQSEARREILVADIARLEAKLARRIARLSRAYGIQI